MKDIKEHSKDRRSQPTPQPVVKKGKSHGNKKTPLDNPSLTSIFDSIDAPIYVADMTTYEVFFINKYGRETWGEIEGKLCWQTVHTDQKGPCQFCANNDLLDSHGKPRGLYTREFQDKATQRWKECRSLAIRWTNGQYVRLEVAYDITERKNAEETLRKSESRYRSVYNMVRLMCDNVPDMIWAKDLEKRYIFANKAICTDLLNAHDTDEPIGKTDMFFIQREQAAQPENRSWHTFGEVCGDSDSIVMAEKRSQRFDEFGNVRNTFLYLDVHKAPFFDEKGTMIGTVGAGRDVTKEKAIEHTLREKERQLHLIANSLPVLIAYIGKDQRYQYINKTFEDWFRIKKEEMYGKHIKEVVGDDAYSLLEEHIEKVLQGNKVLYEEKLAYKTGTRFVSGMLVPDSGINSEAKGFYALVSDISERKRMEEALRASEERYHALFQNIPVGVGITTIDGKIIAYNEMMQHITGYSKYALEKMGAEDLYYNKEDRKTITDILTKKGAVHNFETRLKHQNGRIFHASLNIVSYSMGEQDVILTALQDISERKKTEKALTESEQRLSYIINFLPDATFAIDKEGRIIVWNRAIEQMTGISSVQVLGKGNYEHAVHFYGKRRPILADLILKPDRDTEKTYTFVTREMDCLIAEPVSPLTILGQIRYLWAKASPIYDADGNTIGAIESIRDITERKKTEEILKKNEQTIQTLLNANPETEILVDKRSLILAGNNTFAKRIGKGINDIIGLTFSDLFPPDIAEAREAKLREVFSTGKLVQYTDSRNETTYDIYQYPVFTESGAIEMVAIFAMDITNRVKAEDALHESEERYRTAIEYSNDGIAILKGSKHIYVNRKLAEMFGYNDPREVVGKTHAVTVHPDDLERVSDINNRRQRGEAAPLRYEFKGIKKNGDVIYIEASVTNTQYRGESVSLAYLRDITDRKLSADALRDSEIKYHTLLDNLSDAVFLMLKNVFIDCNEKALIVFGCTRKDIIGKTPHAFSPPTQPDGRDSQQKVMEIIERTLSGDAQFFEWRHCKLDGTIFDAEVNLNSIELEGRTHIQAIVRDITQRKQYNQSLKMSLAKLRKATGGIIDVIGMAVEMRDPYTAGHQKRVANLARSIAKEMGLPEENIDGIRMAGIIHDLGKISIPAEILTRPRALTEIEYDLVKTHSQVGYDILKDIEFPWPIADIVHQHHERLNGTGYPKGLRQADILLEARIIAVCDVVESMASHRPYRPALGIDAALEEITKNKGLLYDAEVVDICVHLFKEKGFLFE